MLGVNKATCKFKKKYMYWYSFAINFTVAPELHVQRFAIGFLFEKKAINEICLSPKMCS